MSASTMIDEVVLAEQDVDDAQKLVTQIEEQLSLADFARRRLDMTRRTLDRLRAVTYVSAV